MKRQKRVSLELLLSAFLFLLALSTPAHAQWSPLNAVTAVEKRGDGVLFTLKTGTLKLEVCSDTIVRVLFSPTGSFPQRKDYVVIKQSWPAVDWTGAISSGSASRRQQVRSITPTVLPDTGSRIGIPAQAMPSRFSA